MFVVFLKAICLNCHAVLTIQCAVGIAYRFCVRPAIMLSNCPCIQYEQAAYKRDVIDDFSEALRFVRTSNIVYYISEYSKYSSRPS